MKNLHMELPMGLGKGALFWLLGVPIQSSSYSCSSGDSAAQMTPHNLQSRSTAKSPASPLGS
jgi:hypothetical protein